MRLEFPITMVTAMVSPSARPSPRITAPRMPGRATSTVSAMASARVAPSASADSRSARGMATRISREIDTIVGRIITPSTREALSMPMPKGAPRKSGRNPPWAISHGSTQERRNGASTNRPHRP